MKSTKRFQLSGISWIAMFFIVFVSVADVTEEFDSLVLNEALWEMKVVGKASYEIKDGILEMYSPAVESGIMLYYPVNVEDVDITFEVKLDTFDQRPEDLTVGFIAELMEPQLNTNINDNWEANFFFKPDSTWYIKQDPIVIGQKPPNPPELQGPYKGGWNVVKVDSRETQGKITFFLNEKEVGAVDKNPEVKTRYFYIGPDRYTSHVVGDVFIDYIKISGPGAPTLAVEPSDKLTTTWGRMKNWKLP